MLCENPLVSILMTAFNREKYIEEAIESVLANSYANFELIIVDDCSSDGTCAIASKYAAADSRVKLYFNEKNLGDYPNRNRAISYASGEYCMFCDSDDTLVPDSISRLMDHVKNDPGFNFAFAWPQNSEFLKLTPEVAIRKHFFEQAFLFIGPGGTFMRTSFVRSVGGYPELYGPANDMYFNLKVACSTPVVLFPFNLQFYREHDGQEIKNKYSYLYNGFKYLDNALREIPLPLSAEQLEFLRKKNYRRFIVNLFLFFKKERDVKKSRNAWKLAGYNFRYLLKGIFH